MTEILLPSSLQCEQGNTLSTVLYIWETTGKNEGREQTMHCQKDTQGESMQQEIIIGHDQGTAQQSLLSTCIYSANVVWMCTPVTFSHSLYTGIDLSDT